MTSILRILVISFLIALPASILLWNIPELVRKVPTLEQLSELLGLLLFIPSLPLSYVVDYILRTTAPPPDPVDFGILVITYTLNIFILLLLYKLARKLLVKSNK